MEKYWSAPFIPCEEHFEIEEMLKKATLHSLELVFEKMQLTKSESIPEKHRCICTVWRALDLIRENRYAGVMLGDLLFVLYKIQKVKICKIYKTDTHGVVFILHK